MATERHRLERHAHRIRPGAGASVVRRLFLLGVLAFLGWCGLALVAGASASAAEPSGSASTSPSLLGSGTLTDVVHEASSAVRSVGTHPSDPVSVRQGGRRLPRHSGAVASVGARNHAGETSRTGVDPAPGRLDRADRSLLGLVSVPVRRLADPDASVPVPVDTAVSAVERTLGHVAGGPLRSVTRRLMAPVGSTVSRATARLAAAWGGVPAEHVAVASPDASRSAAGVATTQSDWTRHGSGVRTLAPGSDDATGNPRAGLPGGYRHLPTAPAAGDAPAMPFGVAGGSASGGGSGNAGASGAYLDFAGVRPSAASGPVRTVRHNDEQVPVDSPDRPRVSPD